MKPIFLDSFRGAAADLKGAARTADNVLAALNTSPRVSTWDLSENAWLWRLIKDLIRDGRITEDKTEPYPWHRYRVSEAPNHPAGEKP